MTNQKEVAPLAAGQKTHTDIIAKFYPLEAAFHKDFDSTDDDFDIIIDDWLIPETIEMNAITIIYAPSKQGKSYFALSLIVSLLLFRQDKIFLYIDMDNSMKTAEQRGFKELKNMYKNFIHIGRKKAFEIKSNVIDRLLCVEPERLKNYVIVLDSLRNFISADLKDTQPVKAFMEKLEKLRELGVTIIALHHSTKSDARIFSGAEDIRASADNMFFVENLLKGTDKQKDMKDEFYFRLVCESSRSCWDVDEKVFYANLKQKEFRECDKIEALRVILPDICFKVREFLEDGDKIQSKVYEQVGCTAKSMRDKIAMGLGKLYKTYRGDKNNSIYYTSI